MERTYVMVKPDGVERRLSGEIIRRFENRGLRLVALKMLVPTRATAETHYAVHSAKPFFGELVDFVVSGPVVAMVWEGKDAIKLCRQMIGATKPLEAAPGPSADDVAAAQDMSPEDRQAMIRGMVGQLNDRLATSGGPPEDWARLISSYGVLGETDAARTIWTEAQTVFADSDAAMAMLRDAAQSAGVLE